MTPMQQHPAPSSKGKLSPRAHGAVLVGIGVAMEAANGAYLAIEGKFFPTLVIIGAALLPLGAWTLVTGIAYDKTSPVKPPAWWTVGAVVLTLGGVGIGIFVSEWLQR
jgi:hypothetical protein